MAVRNAVLGSRAAPPQNARGARAHMQRWMQPTTLLAKPLHMLEKSIQELSLSTDFLNEALHLRLALARYLIRTLSAHTELEQCQLRFKMLR
jgi:hypothetical protein